MSTDARRPDAPASGPRPTLPVAPPTPVRSPSVPAVTVARPDDAPRVVPTGTTPRHVEVSIRTVITAGVAR